MIISISGRPGSGKSTAGKRVAGRLGMHFFSMGDLRGQMAVERGMTIFQMNQSPEDTDTPVDKMIEKMGQTQDNFVIDGRLAWHFIPKSFKIFLDVDPRVGAERVMQGTRPDEPKYESIEEAMRMLAGREQNDRERYHRLYGVNHLDLSNYDLVIDTTKIGKDKVVANILKAFKGRGSGGL